MRARWVTPSFVVLVGLALLAAAALAGHPTEGLYMLGVMAVCSVGFVLTDRLAQVEQQASALAGVVVILALIGGFLYEIAQGHDGAPYTWLCVLGSVTYLASIVFLRARR